MPGRLDESMSNGFNRSHGTEEQKRLKEMFLSYWIGGACRRLITVREREHFKEQRQDDNAVCTPRGPCTHSLGVWLKI